MRLQDGWIAELQPYVANKNVAACMLMTWPMLLISRPIARVAWHKALRLATVAAFVVAALLSEHETSKLALAVSAAVFAIAWRSRQAAFRLIALGWIAASALVLPISLIAYKAGAHKLESIQYSGRHRVVIWGFTGQRVLDRPFTGYGLASTRVLDEASVPEPLGAGPNATIPLATSMHSHNVFMQTFHETGVIGGLLMMLAGLPILGWLRTRSDATFPYLFAAFAAAVTLASLSWSLVAPWYIASFGLVAVWCRFGDVFVADEDGAAASPTIVAAR